MKDLNTDSDDSWKITQNVAFYGNKVLNAQCSIYKQLDKEKKQKVSIF